MNCDICLLKKECHGCPPGTDPGAQARLDELKNVFGFICPALRCAVQKQVDYCLNCDEFPCTIHYWTNYPYSEFLLDAFKAMKEMKGEFGSEAFKKEQRRIAVKYQKPKPEKK